MKGIVARLALVGSALVASIATTNVATAGFYECIEYDIDTPVTGPDSDRICSPIDAPWPLSQPVSIGMGPDECVGARLSQPVVIKVCVAFDGHLLPV